MAHRYYCTEFLYIVSVVFRYLTILSLLFSLEKKKKGNVLFNRKVKPAVAKALHVLGSLPRGPLDQLPPRLQSAGAAHLGWRQRHMAALGAHSPGAGVHTISLLKKARVISTCRHLMIRRLTSPSIVRSTTLPHPSHPATQRCATSASGRPRARHVGSASVPAPRLPHYAPPASSSESPSLPHHWMRARARPCGR